jgi:ubiquinone/menaquinone biosynthesis C-methylase UbiE
MVRQGGYEYWDARAQIFDESTERITSRETETLINEWLLANVNEHDSALDLGCGTGRYAAVIAGSAARVIAADRSPAMLEEARKKLCKHDNVSLRQEDCLHTSFDNEFFDVVVMGNLLHIVRSPERVVKESFRLLKPGGRLLAVDYTSKGMRLSAVLRMMLTILTTWGLPSTDNRIVAPDTLRGMASAAGFEAVEAELIGPTVKAVCLNARKPDLGPNAV